MGQILQPPHMPEAPSFLTRRSHHGYVYCCPIPAAPWPTRLPDLEQDASNALLRLQVGTQY